jgi:alpha-tubulin suppressor-like RCC1 family protein
VPPPGLGNVVAIAAAWHDLALKSDGTVVAWGVNWSGESTVPPGLSDVVAIAAGSERSLMLKNDGSLFIWGENSYGRATVAPDATNVVAIAAGDYHNVALRSDGTVVAWGHTGFGQAPAPPGLSNVVAIGAGNYSSFAIKSDGTLVQWGQMASAPPLTNVIAGAAGPDHSLALVVDLRILSITVSNKTPLLDFQTFAGRQYAVEYASDLATGNWTNLPAGNLNGNGFVASITDSNAFSAAAARFYRVREFP